MAGNSISTRRAIRKRFAGGAVMRNSNSTYEKLRRTLHREKTTMQLTGQDQILSSACAMSAMRSSLLSRPQLMRTSSAGTPAAFSCSSFI